MFAVSCIVYILIIFYGKLCVVMADTKKEENLSKSNFGHTENEWGTNEKIYCECPTCKDTTKKGKKNSDPHRIVAYKLNGNF